ncbi:MAG TPA: flagellar filament capping protein FliD [Solirubrobacteraceae bacterium]|nr:flagellar filament capping protein FliD [Solirubrobacteraceae bacterium]
MASGLRLGGLSSGLDTDAIVSQLMAIERQPRGRLERKQAAVQARQDALRDISTKLKTLKSAAQALASSATWAPTQSITSSDATRVGARAVGSIAPGTYDVEVQRLATTASRTLNTTVRPNPVTFKVTTVATGAQYNINIPANATVDDIVRVINSDANAPVVARNYNGQLLVSAKVMGAAGNFTFDGSNVVTSEASSVTGVDSQFKVNGVTYTRPTNTITDVVAGAELTLNGTTTSAVQVTVGSPTVDPKTLAAKVKAFVDAYNAVVDATRSRTTEKRVTNPTTTTDAKKGVLFGDSGLSNMLSQLRVGVMDPISVGNSLTMDEFAEIGVSTGTATGGTSNPDAVAGKLQFDETKFLASYQADPSSVERLLRGTEVSPGLSSRVDRIIQPFTEVGGMFEGRLTAATSELSRLGDQIKRMDERLGRKETYLRRQFTALETALTKLNSQSTEISSRLAGLSNDD